MFHPVKDLFYNYCRLKASFLLWAGAMLQRMFLNTLAILDAKIKFLFVFCWFSV